MINLTMNNVSMYRSSRKSTKVFNSDIISSEGYNVPGFKDIVYFCNPISTASFTSNVIQILKKTYVGKVIASIIENIIYLDYYHHIDSIADGNLMNGTIINKFFFDLKDVEDKNVGTGNYSISEDCLDYFKKSTDNYWFAFRLNYTKNGGTRLCRLNAFVCVKAHEVVVNCSPISNIVDRYVFSLRDIIKKCSSKFFVGDRNDLNIYKRFSSNGEIDWSFAELK